ncbi:sialidase family protein [Gemmata sp.]|uniref:sialidase family protein n=1 Tax=Gemmata sp. TaxID=1914242 RepID=UPI003F72D40E
MSSCQCGVGWVKFTVLAALVAGGAATGLYLSGALPPFDEPQTVCPAAPQGSPCWETDTAGPQHRFPLSPLDVKDTMEAPELAVNCCGKVFLAWASKTGEAERTVFFTKSADGTAFDAPRAVSKAGVYKTPAKGKMAGHERRATPHLAAMGQEVLLAWGDALPDNAGMRYALATSTDTGATFGAPRPVHRGEKASAAFTSFARGLGGVLACVWLDGRNGSQQVYASVQPADAEAFGPEVLVHAGEPGKGVCPCCPTAATFAKDGTLYVAFRNINDGFRDIAVSRLRPGQTTFEGPFPVVDKAWKFEGCPHDGPSLAVVGDTLHVAWMDARTGTQRAYFASASVADMKFAARELNAGAAGTQGNAKLFADAAGNLHAVWEQSTGTEPAPASTGGHQHAAPSTGSGAGRAVQYAVMPKGQPAFGPVRAIAPKAGAFQTRPSIAVSPNGAVFVAWNELDTAGKAVVVSQLSTAAAEACHK